MPQLDITTYFSQFFWLVVFFGIFYLFLLRHILPRLARIYKYRFSLNSSLSNPSTIFELEKKDSGDEYQKLAKFLPFHGFTVQTTLRDSTKRQYLLSLLPTLPYFPERLDFKPARRLGSGCGPFVLQYMQRLSGRRKLFFRFFFV